MTLAEIQQALERLGVSLSPENLKNLQTLLNELLTALKNLESLSEEDLDQRLSNLLELLRKLEMFLISEAAREVFSGEDLYPELKFAVGRLINKLELVELAAIAQKLEALSPDLEAASKNLKAKLEALENLKKILDVMAKLLGFAAQLAPLVI